MLFKDIGPSQLEEHQASIRYPIRAPLRHSSFGNLAQGSNSNSSAKIVDNFICIHAASIEL